MTAPDFTEVARKTFTAGLILEHSSVPSVTDLGPHEQTMTLYFRKDGGGFIEWDIPSADEFAEIGLWFDTGSNGERILYDYDGVFSLPGEAVDLLRSQGILVAPEFDPREETAT